MTREERISQHRLNVAWANECIRACLLARRVLRDEKPEHYWVLIYHSTIHDRPELIPLKWAIDNFRERFNCYKKGLLGQVFDLRYFISEARALKRHPLHSCL